MSELKNLENTLREGTLLVQQAASGELTIQDFIQKYNNFYYYNALDGHEADESTLDLFKKFSELIELHRIIQTEIVNLVFFDNQTDSTQYLDAGRLTPDMAKKRIEVIVKKFGLVL